MKKFILLFFIPIYALAQIKIGDLTISESIAKEYFLDLYQRPDTLNEDSYHNYTPKNFPFYEKDYEWAKIKVETFNKRLHTENIGILRDTVWYFNYPNEPDFGWVWYNNISKQQELKNKEAVIKRKEWEAKHDSEKVKQYYVNLIGYLMPRTPSASDFAKWFKSK